MRRGKLSRRKILILWAVAFAAMPISGSAQTRTKDTEWPSYTADLAGTRYRALDQINASNFNDLEIAWRIKTDNFGDRPEYKLEGTPLMVNSVLYATAGITARGDSGSTRPRVNCSGSTASMKESAAGQPQDNSPAADWRTGPTARKNESFT